jgi:4-carboxymuconolactone decarboxylase
MTPAPPVPATAAPAGPGRLPVLPPDALDDEQRALYDRITQGPRASGPQVFRLVDDDGGLAGPFNAFLLQPALGGPLQELGAAVRYRTGLSHRCREIAVLVVAAHWGSAFERHAHEAIGRALGLTDDELAAVREQRYDVLDGEPERLVARTARLLAADGDLDDPGYAAAVAGLGEAGLFELLTLVGYYAALALQLRVFRVPPPIS